MADFREQSSDAVVKLPGIAAAAADPAMVVALSPNSALPQPDVNATGTITTTDIVVAAPAGAGALVTGTPTAGSVVFSAITGGYTAWVAQITGLTSGTIYFEASADSTTGADGNWINVIGRQIGVLNSLVTGNATGNGNWRGNVSGYKFFRLRSVGTLTGTPAILIRMSAGVATVFLNGSIPTGANVIGRLGIDQTTPGTTNLVAVARADATSTGTLAAAAQTVELALSWAGTAGIQIQGTWAGVIAFEGTIDGTNWFPMNSTQLSVGPVTVQATTVNGIYVIACGSMAKVRANMTTFTSGTATVNLRSSASPNGTFLNQPIPLPAITKGTQGTVGVSTQDLKDSGRVAVAINCYQAAGIITTEALFAASTFSSSRDGATATTGQQFTVTTGKRFRLQATLIGIKNTAAAAGTSKLVLRYAAAGGVITNTSPIVKIWDFGSNATVANAYIGPNLYEIPDGLELLPNATFGFTVLSSAVTMLHTITLIGYEY